MEPHLPALHFAFQIGLKVEGQPREGRSQVGGAVRGRRHKGRAARQSVPGDQ